MKLFCVRRPEERVRERERDKGKTSFLGARRKKKPMVQGRPCAALLTTCPLSLWNTSGAFSGLSRTSHHL